MHNQIASIRPLPPQSASTNTMSLEDDSSDEETAYSTTNVLLGYASQDPTGDEISFLGGKPTWLSDTRPSYELVRCKVCRMPLSQLLQLNGELPEHFPLHDRRLHILACRKKACSRKPGSVRVLRATRHRLSSAEPPQQQQVPKPAKANFSLGNDIFGGGSTPATAANPFANPFAKAPTTPNTASTAAPVAKSEAMSFAVVTKPSSQPRSRPVVEPWPPESLDTNDFSKLYLDAAYEYLDESSKPDPSSSSRVSMLEDENDNTAGASSTSNMKEDQDGFESSLDKTFQRFADRISQNPEQVLRYEFRGAPMLYSGTDEVGRIFHRDERSKAATARRGMPGCNNCGKARSFELQLTPHAISELEKDELGLDGMDWGTILVGVCEADCQMNGIDSGEVGYLEEWAGVQWEELKK